MAARRELAEELGIRGVPLRYALQFVHARGGNHIFGSAFVVDYDGPLTLQADEVAEAFWVPLGEALTMAQVTPDTRQAVEALVREGWLNAPA